MSKMKEYHSENGFHITENGWMSSYSVGDLVKVNKNKLGIVLHKATTQQETMFPYVRVLILNENLIFDYGFTSLEIVSKA